MVEDTPTVYQVNRHDTLYSIAWRHNLDYRQLASANGIGPPYLIREGQQIRLVETRGLSAAPAAQAQPAEPSAPKAAPPPARAKPTPKAQPKRKAARAKPPAPAPARPKTAPAKPRAAPAPAKAKSPPPGKGNAQAKPPLLATVASDGWRRPVAERPVRRFGKGSKGFDYQLAPATRIHAASGGIVVYAGPGLAGFRHLVIVKASDRYLVAYGVNARPALAEGETVLPGTVVARIESGGPEAGKFHFEIRDRGKPVDPGKLIRS